MKPGLNSLLCVVLIFFAGQLLAQKNEHVPGVVLASLTSETDPAMLKRRFETTYPEIPLTHFRNITRLLNIWMFETSPRESAENTVLNWLRQQPEVRAAQLDHVLELREERADLQLFTTIPNDPLFSAQWQMVNDGSNGGTPDADMDADEAWDLTRGGITPAGDTIVIAVIDGGIDPTHEDLAPNLWRNIAEIAGDYIDNDGNGYADDYLGWNVYTQSDDIVGTAMTHGTSVSGIAGAKGDNGIGISGVNWCVKLMFVAGNNPESAVLEAYDYILSNRLLYNATHGEKGAFVVAANCSWGINYGQPADSPLWCEAFDVLGQAGILSVAATANIPVDVDSAGDLPTTCPSEFLLTVTSLDRNDQKPPNAAWGASSIDLGAYGHDITTTTPGSTYTEKSGTSYASPQVSGMVGLLYAAPCPNLIELAKTVPAQAALTAKQLILEAAPYNASLDGITLSEGKLNLNDVLLHYLDQCTPCPPPFDVAISVTDAQDIAVEWAQLIDYQTVFVRWRPLGTYNWNFAANAQSPFVLANLEHCTAYEISLKANCQGGLSSNWSEPVIFTTMGCCVPPDNISTEWTTANSAFIVWDSLAHDLGYELRIRTGNNNWTSIYTPVPYILVENLNACTLYEYQVRTYCDSVITDFSAFKYLLTTGCGACTDAVYCTSNAVIALEEWIESVEIDNWVHESGGFWGYEDFTDLEPSDELCLASNTSLPLTITPGFSGQAYNEYFKIFIDYNMDGDFDDEGETAFDPGFAYNGPQQGFIHVPSLTSFGKTRMRVAMKYLNPLDTPPHACESFQFGQVEDYCVHLQPFLVRSSESPDEAYKLRVYPQPASEWVNLERSSGAPICGNLYVMKTDGSIQADLGDVNKTVAPMRINISEWPKGMYFIRLQMEDGKVYFQKMLKQ